jgi:hypothetical protein
MRGGVQILCSDPQEYHTRIAALFRGILINRPNFVGGDRPRRV